MFDFNEKELFKLSDNRKLLKLFNKLKSLDLHLIFEKKVGVGYRVKSYAFYNTKYVRILSIDFNLDSKKIEIHPQHGRNIKYGDDFNEIIYNASRINFDFFLETIINAEGKSSPF